MTISIIQAVAKNTLTSTIPATGGPNHSLIYCINSFSGSGAPTITGVTIGGVALTQAVAKILNNSGSTASWIYYKSGVASGQTAVVVAGTNLTVDSVDGGVDIIEVDGLITAGALDKTISASGTTTAWSTGSSGTLSQPEELVVGTGDVLSSGNPSLWTMVSGGGSSRKTGYKIVAATTAQTFNATQSAVQDWTAVLASFKGGTVRRGLLPFLLAA